MTSYYRTMKPPPLTSPFFGHETHLIPCLQWSRFDRRKPDLQFSLVSSVPRGVSIPSFASGGQWSLVSAASTKDRQEIRNSFFLAVFLPSFSCPLWSTSSGGGSTHILVFSTQSRGYYSVSFLEVGFFFFSRENRFCHVPGICNQEKTPANNNQVYLPRALSWGGRKNNVEKEPAGNVLVFFPRNFFALLKVCQFKRVYFYEKG